MPQRPRRLVPLPRSLTPRSLIPRSLAARTALVLLVGLLVVQAVGLAIHALDRIDFARLNNEREVAVQVAGLYRTLADAEPSARDAELRRQRLAPGQRALLTAVPILAPLHATPERLRRGLRRRLQFMPIPPRLRPIQVILADNRPEDAAGPAEPREPQPGFEGRRLGGGLLLHGGSRYAIALQFPDDARWLTVRFVMPLADPFLSPTLPLAFLVVTLLTGLLSAWAVRRLTAPLRTLAVAAEKLGRDVNADPLPENGPTEVATAAVAFNTMASRIRRFVTDRTLLLAAIGHDLRTPITRLKLRSEFIEDEELQAKFLADLDELEAMVSATLAFGRDSANREPMVALDLNALLRTVLDDAVDGLPVPAGAAGFASPPPPVTIQARPLALKRALANLVGNAVAYGGAARVTLRPAEHGYVTVLVEDDGPGIPPAELDRVFEPFVRLEASRNRETGGTGLGLSIARTIVRGQGGDIALANRAPHGLRATVTLVA